VHPKRLVDENKPVGSKAGTHLAGRDLVVSGACADATGTAARERPEERGHHEIVRMFAHWRVEE